MSRSFSWSPSSEAAILTSLLARRHEVHFASEILPGRLYISDASMAYDEDGLKQMGVTHVVSVLEYAPPIAHAFNQLHIPIADTFETNILRYFEETTKFIRSALAENDDTKVLVRRAR